MRGEVFNAAFDGHHDAWAAQWTGSEFCESSLSKCERGLPPSQPFLLSSAFVEIMAIEDELKNLVCQISSLDLTFTAAPVFQPNLKFHSVRRALLSSEGALIAQSWLDSVVSEVPGEEVGRAFPKTTSNPLAW